MSPLFSLFIIPQTRIKINTNWHRDFGRIWRGGGHTSVPTYIKTSRFWKKRNIPRDYRGMFNIPGGQVSRCTISHTRIHKYRDFTGNFSIFCPAISCTAYHQPIDILAFFISKVTNPHKNNREFNSSEQGN